jgi:Na+/H+ antiporter NhaD/arsenite permease-like protein
MKKVGFKDLAFFALLFVLVGGVHASGALDFVTDKIIMIAGDSKLLQCMVLMWLAAALTALLNAGPATALMLPILIDLRPGPPHHLLWWALSLGVCAGSSATLVGATAGPTAATIVERYFKTRAGAALKNLAFGEREYAYIGIPVCFVFLLVSSAYVLFVYVS